MKKTPRLIIDESRQEVKVNGREVRLAPKEFQILCELKNAGITLNRKTLIEKVWPSETAFVIDSRAVDQHIHRLREKIGRDLIQTSTCYGYKLAAGV